MRATSERFHARRLLIAEIVVVEGVAKDERY
jgi:hypothetical protein